MRFEIKMKDSNRIFRDGFSPGVLVQFDYPLDLDGLTDEQVEMVLEEIGPAFLRKFFEVRTVK